MENLSCHSNNQTAWTTALKDNVIVEAMVRNNSAMFQLYIPSEELIFEYFFSNFAFWFLLVAMVTNQIKGLQQKKIWFVENHSRNIYVNFSSKYLQ